MANLHKTPKFVDIGTTKKPNLIDITEYKVSLSHVENALKRYGFGFTEIQLILWNLEHNSEKIIIIK